MTPDERDLVTQLFARLRASERPDRDRDAAARIRQSVAAQPAGPYQLVQLALVQEHALQGAQARIAELEREVEAARAAGPPPRSFLGGILGTSPWRQQDSPRPTLRPVPDTPTAPSAPGGGAFLRQAIATAAGVAGGALMFSGIQSLLGQAGGPLGHLAQGGAEAPQAPGIDELTSFRSVDAETTPAPEQEWDAVDQMALGPEDDIADDGQAPS